MNRIPKAFLLNFELNEDKEEYRWSVKLRSNRAVAVAAVVAISSLHLSLRPVADIGLFY